MPFSDLYNTIAKPSKEVIFKDRGSKFFGYAFPIQDEDEVKAVIGRLKEQHHKARHWCYAWRLGVNNGVKFRTNDDGEPNNSAGQPIYGQILSKGITNVLVVVVRYFGGTKLGVSGLINAYKTAAFEAIAISEIVERTIDSNFILQFEYKDLNKVMRLIKELDVTLKEQHMELSCEFLIAVRKNKSKDVVQAIEKLHNVQVKEA